MMKIYPFILTFMDFALTPLQWAWGVRNDEKVAIIGLLKHGKSLYRFLAKNKVGFAVFNVADNFSFNLRHILWSISSKPGWKHVPW
jgi:hypothetical protein